MRPDRRLLSGPILLTPTRNAVGDALIAQVGANGQIKFYAGTPPANVNTALGANTLLGTLACSATFAPAASGGQVVVNPITDDSAADATGAAAFYRVFKSGGHHRRYPGSGRNQRRGRPPQQLECRGVAVSSGSRRWC